MWDGRIMGQLGNWGEDEEGEGTKIGKSCL